MQHGCRETNNKSELAFNIPPPPLLHIEMKGNSVFISRAGLSVKQPCRPSFIAKGRETLEKLYLAEGCESMKAVAAILDLK